MRHEKVGKGHRGVRREGGRLGRLRLELELEAAHPRAIVCESSALLALRKFRPRPWTPWTPWSETGALMHWNVQSRVPAANMGRNSFATAAAGG